MRGFFFGPNIAAAAGPALDVSHSVTLLNMYNIRFILARTACAINLFLYIQTCVANPLGPAASRPGPNHALTVTPEPICTRPEVLANSTTTSPPILQTFPRECIDTANHFFNFPSPMAARISWCWKRFDRQHMPGPGYNVLPYSAAPTGCMLRLDVLEDPAAEDQFPLVQIEAEFRALFTKCVRGRVHDVSAGYVVVGPRKLLKLSIGPTPMGGMDEPTNVRLVPNVLAERSFNDLL